MSRATLLVLFPTLQSLGVATAPLFERHGGPALYRALSLDRDVEGLRADANLVPLSHYSGSLAHGAGLGSVLALSSIVRHSHSLARGDQ